MSIEIIHQIWERVQQDPAFRHSLLDTPRMVLSHYDLTEEEKHQFIAPNFSWLLADQLAGVSGPRSEDACALLKRFGIQAVISLTEKPLPAQWLARFELLNEHIPIADFTAPTLPQIEQAITAINTFLAQGLPVVVYCAAGLGRTGTILACYLIWQRVTAEAAIEQVRRQRPGSIETPDQEAAIRLYELQRKAPHDVP